jgi:Flp pilus assembly protein TadD
MRQGGTRHGGGRIACALVVAAGFVPALGCARSVLRPSPPAAVAPATPAPPTVTPRATAPGVCVANPSVVTVLTGDARQRGLASGFLVARDRVVTCLHVVDGKGSARVRFADRAETPVLAVLAEDRVHDLVLLSIPPAGAPVLLVSDEPVTAGTTLHVVSSCQGRAQTAGSVLVTRAEQPRKRLGRAFRARGAIGPGSSGCPVLDDGGRVRGVVAEQDLSGPATGLVVPSRFVSALVAGPGEPMASYGARTAANPELALRDAYEDSLRRLRSGDREGARRGAERVYAQGRASGSLYAWNALSVLRGALTPTPNEAVTRFRQIAAENPTEAEPAVTLGVLFAELNRTEESIAAFREATRREPGEAEAHALLAGELWNAGRSAEAESAARAALAIDPDALQALSVAGNARLAQGRPLEALPPFERAATLSPESAETRCNLGAALANSGRHAEGRAHLEAAVRFEPRLALAHENLARVHVATGDLAAARRERDILRPLDRAAAEEISTLIARAERSGLPAVAAPPAPPAAIPVAPPPIPPAPPALPPPASRRVG